MAGFGVVIIFCLVGFSRWACPSDLQPTYTPKFTSQPLYKLFCVFILFSNAGLQ